MQSRIVLRPALAVVFVSLVAIFGNQFVSGWNWSPSDFLVMGVLIFGAGLLAEIANMKIKNKNYKIAAIAAVLVVLLITWVHLAVGIVDTWPFAGS